MLFLIDLLGSVDDKRFACLLDRALNGRYDRLADAFEVDDDLRSHLVPRSREDLW